MKMLFLFIFILLAMTVAGALSSCGIDEEKGIYETLLPYGNDTLIYIEPDSTI